ncbi:unnamed protein product [Coccothraustes coccothraustes]
MFNPFGAAAEGLPRLPSQRALRCQGGKGKVTASIISFELKMLRQSTSAPALSFQSFCCWCAQDSLPCHSYALRARGQ